MTTEPRIEKAKIVTTRKNEINKKIEKKLDNSFVEYKKFDTIKKVKKMSKREADEIFARKSEIYK